MIKRWNQRHTAVSGKTPTPLRTLRN